MPTSLTVLTDTNENILLMTYALSLYTLSIQLLAVAILMVSGIISAKMPWVRAFYTDSVRGSFQRKKLNPCNVVMYTVGTWERVLRRTGGD